MDHFPSGAPKILRLAAGTIPEGSGSGNYWSCASGGRRRPAVSEVLDPSDGGNTFSEKCAEHRSRANPANRDRADDPCSRSDENPVQSDHT